MPSLPKLMFFFSIFFDVLSATSVAIVYTAYAMNAATVRTTKKMTSGTTLERAVMIAFEELRRKGTCEVLCLVQLNVQGVLSKSEEKVQPDSTFENVRIESVIFCKLSS